MERKTLTLTLQNAKQFQKPPTPLEEQALQWPI
jgi:hypothetical protein